MTKRPVLGVTLGDPAGIGIEVTLKALARAGANCRLLLIGEAVAVGPQLHFAPEGARLNAIASPQEACWEPGVVNLLDVKALQEAVPLGRIDAKGGEAASPGR